MAHAAIIQDDIAKAFSVRADRVFHRANQQVYAIVGVNPELGVISDVWFDRFDTEDEFRAVLNHMRRRMTEGGFYYWLADLRFLAVDLSGSRDWVVDELMPAVIAAGLIRQALVLPQIEEGADSDRMAAVAKTLHKISEGRVRSFTDIQLAKQWLLDGDGPGKAK